jgi:antitoxin component YwqK of YwqJK toxin-antitoxin module
MKKLLVIVSLAFGSIALGGGLYARLQGRSPDPTRTYYGDGQCKNATIYVDGVKDGRSEQWYPGGAKEWDGSYQDGYREGRWMFWNEDGSLDQERSGDYQAGQRVAGL